jgi:DNA-binding PadR family transcriptional regulator
MFQAEFSLTQVFSRPAYGRRFFEEVIREHVDLGRPEYVQLIFGRRVTKRTPGLFRTRLMNYGTIPTFRVYYKNTHIKQYFKESLGLRTETTINNTYDFRIGRRLCNFSRLREIGLQANRRLLRVQRLSHDPAVGAEVFETLSSPLWVGDQRVARLTFSDKRVQVLMSCLIQWAMRPDGFRNAEMRVQVAQLMGQDPATYKPGKMTYDLRRLRLHGLIEREEGSHRYQVTEAGLRQAMVYVRTYKRVVVPLLSEPADLSKATPELRKAQAAIDKYIKAQKAAKEAA